MSAMLGWSIRQFKFPWMQMETVKKTGKHKKLEKMETIHNQAARKRWKLSKRKPSGKDGNCPKANKIQHFKKKKV